MRWRRERPPAVAYLAAAAGTEPERNGSLLQGALYDDLTGLPERALLLDRIAQALARARRSGEHVGVLLVTLEDGQPDRVLRDVADRLRQSIRETDTAARFGPAEFAVLCDGIGEQDTLLIVANRAAGLLATIGVTVGLEVLLVDADTTPGALLDLAEATLRKTRTRVHGG